MDKYNFVVLTISDTCSSGTKTDQSGPQIVECVNRDFPGSAIHTNIIPDEEDAIAKSLIFYSDIIKADVILTTGGTGFSHRDVTPEATRKVIDKLADGISIALHVESLKITPMAKLSRLVSGIRGKTLIINFPGSSKAVRECFNIVKGVLPHAVELLAENIESVKVTHDIINPKPRALNPTAHKCSHRDPVDGPKDVLTPMIEAKAIVKNVFRTGYRRNCTIIPYTESLGYVTAEDVLAVEPFPPFNASIKDGYACLFEDGKGFRFVQYGAAAGDNPGDFTRLERGQCAKINTGAPIPLGANCVVMIEDTRVIEQDSNGKETKIEIVIPPEEGQEIRTTGSDIKPNEMIISKGSIIQPADIGLFATIGKIHVNVYAKPIVGILSTGNELFEPSAAVLPSGHIRDSNKATLTSLFGHYGFPVKDYGIVIDDPNELEKRLALIFDEVSILVTTGGVSKGDRDYIKDVLKNSFGADIHFDKLNMKPGKPTTFATFGEKNSKKIIFGLPGNPVSALVTCQLIVIPALMDAKGIDNYELPKIKVTLGEDVELDPRPCYARAIMKYSPDHQTPIATLTGNQISSRLLSCSGADILLELPGSDKNREYLNRNEIVTALLIK